MDIAILEFRLSPEQLCYALYFPIHTTDVSPASDNFARGVEQVLQQVLLFVDTSDSITFRASTDPITDNLLGEACSRDCVRDWTEAVIDKRGRTSELYLIVVSSADITGPPAANHTYDVQCCKTAINWHDTRGKGEGFYSKTRWKNKWRLSRKKTNKDMREDITEVAIQATIDIDTEVGRFEEGRCFSDERWEKWQQELIRILDSI